MILHADANSFYASCEQIYRPDLTGKPVVVLSNNDGIIVALNKEAKALGLKRGDVFFKLERFCQENQVSVFSSNYTLYADISRRITSIYMEYAPEIEEYSIDESFLFFPKCGGWTREDFFQAGLELKQRVWKEVGVPISVGGGPTKTLAKLYNKKAKEHGGVFIYDPSEVDRLLAATKCGEIWGIGRARAETLEQNGVHTALELKHLPLHIAKKLLTVQGFGTVQELNGIPYLDRQVREKNDSITTSRQFSKQLYDIDTIECALTQYTQLATERLRAQGDLCGVIHVFLSTCNYAYEKDPDKCYSDGVSLMLEKPTSYTPDILRAAIHGLKQIFRQGYGYKTVMITLLDLRPDTGQGELWGNEDEDNRQKRLMGVVDALKNHYDKSVISMGRGLFASGWENKRARLSPCWTTRFSDCPRIK